MEVLWLDENYKYREGIRGPVKTFFYWSSRTRIGKGAELIIASSMKFSIFALVLIAPWLGSGVTNVEHPSGGGIAANGKIISWKYRPWWIFSPAAITTPESFRQRIKEALNLQ